MKPKKLNLEKVWQVYLLLKPALENREREDITLDEIDKLIELSKPGTLFECLSIMYDNVSIDIPGMDAVIMFIRSLSDNCFYEFVDFIEALNNDLSK